MIDARANAAPNRFALAPARANQLHWLNTAAISCRCFEPLSRYFEPPRETARRPSSRSIERLTAD